MELRFYLLINSIPHVHFARKLGITKEYFSRILSGKNKPGKFLLEKIKRMTKGKVLPEHFEGHND